MWNKRGDTAWRWVLRLSGLVGVFIGANADPPWPSYAFAVFAGMIGLDLLRERINGRKNNQNQGRRSGDQ